MKTLILHIIAKLRKVSDYVLQKQIVVIPHSQYRVFQIKTEKIFEIFNFYKKNKN